MNYAGKKVVVLGMGVSGRSALSFLERRGAEVTGVDGEQEVSLAGVDLLIVSPGVPPVHPLYVEGRRLGIQIMGEAELGLRHLDVPVLGITGTNGKTTVTFLVEHVLQSVGIKAKALGNSGIPLTTEGKWEVVVAELSSFQLETMTAPCLDAACILNVSEDHLDRHGSMEEYLQVKGKIGSCLKKGGRLIVGEALKEHFSEAEIVGCTPESDVWSDGCSVFVKEKVAFILPKRYRGKVTHEVENILAAFSLCSELGVDYQEFAKSVETFEKPPHRLQLVREVANVRYYNDSKGTNPAATISAVSSFEEKILLIAGGVGKGASFVGWAKFFQGKVLHVFAIGVTAETIKRELSPRIPVTLCKNLSEAVLIAREMAMPKEVILFSPGCASFDQFQNYIQRGDTFVKICNGL